MNWLTDASAHYRMQAALHEGKQVIRKIDGTWHVFGPTRTPQAVGSFIEGLGCANTRVRFDAIQARQQRLFTFVRG
jgi:hypothetical protein